MCPRQRNAIEMISKRNALGNESIENSLAFSSNSDHFKLCTNEQGAMLICRYEFEQKKKPVKSTFKLASGES